jgi:hypothetical protein
VTHIPSDPKRPDADGVGLSVTLALATLVGLALGWRLGVGMLAAIVAVTGLRQLSREVPPVEKSTRVDNSRVVMCPDCGAYTRAEWAEIHRGACRGNGVRSGQTTPTKGS